MRPDQFVTNPIPNMDRPQKMLYPSIVSSETLLFLLREEMQYGPQSRGKEKRISYTITGINREGLHDLRSTLVNGSNTAYETKNMVNARLYCGPLIPNESDRPAILAFPMLVRSRKASR